MVAFIVGTLLTFFQMWCVWYIWDYKGKNKNTKLDKMIVNLTPYLFGLKINTILEENVKKEKR